MYYIVQNKIVKWYNTSTKGQVYEKPNVISLFVSLRYINKKERSYNKIYKSCT